MGDGEEEIEVDSGLRLGRALAVVEGAHYQRVAVMGERII
jgi:hypothetical protein